MMEYIMDLELIHPLLIVYYLHKYNLPKIGMDFQKH